MGIRDRFSDIVSIPVPFRQTRQIFLHGIEFGTEVTSYHRLQFFLGGADVLQLHLHEQGIAHPGIHFGPVEIEFLSGCLLYTSTLPNIVERERDGSKSE